MHFRLSSLNLRSKHGKLGFHSGNLPFVALLLRFPWRCASLEIKLLPLSKSNFPLKTLNLNLIVSLPKFMLELLIFWFYSLLKIWPWWVLTSFMIQTSPNHIQSPILKNPVEYPPVHTWPLLAIAQHHSYIYFLDFWAGQKSPIFGV